MLNIMKPEEEMKAFNPNKCLYTSMKFIQNSIQ